MRCMGRWETCIILNNARLTAKTILERAKMKGFQEVELEGGNQNDNEDKSTGFM